MQLDQLTFPNQFPIQAYEAGKLKINDQFFTHALIVNNGEHPRPWSVANIHSLTLPLLLNLFEGQPEVVLLGTGPTLIFPPFPLLEALRKQQSAGIEIMDTGAACRTYNLLLAEGRQVTAGVIL